MNQLDFFKKFNRLNPLELSVTIVGFLVLTLCLLCSLFYFDNGVGNGGGFRSRGGVTWWFGVTAGENEHLGFSSKINEDCDYFDGKWVWDESYPLYDSKDCLFVDGGFRCSENGRPDNSYTKWRWQPNSCNMPRFTSFFLCLPSLTYFFSFILFIALVTEMNSYNDSPNHFGFIVVCFEGRCLSCSTSLISQILHLKLHRLFMCMFLICHNLGIVLSNVCVCVSFSFLKMFELFQLL